MDNYDLWRWRASWRKRIAATHFIFAIVDENSAAFGEATYPGGILTR